MYYLRQKIEFNSAVMGYFKGRGFAQGKTLLKFLSPIIEKELRLLPSRAGEILRGSYQGWETDGLVDRIEKEEVKFEGPKRVERKYCIIGRVFDQKKLDDWCIKRTARMGKQPFPYWRVVEGGAKAHEIKSPNLMKVHLRSLEEVYGKVTKSDERLFDKTGFILRYGPFWHPGYKGVGFIRRSRYELRRTLKRLVPALVDMHLKEVLGSGRMVPVKL